MSNLKVGLLVTGSAHFDRTPAESILKESLTFLQSLDVRVIAADAVITTPEELAGQLAKFDKSGLDMLIVQPGCFTWDDIIAEVAQWRPDLPLMLWAVSEPPMAGGVLQQNSLCSAMMNGATLGKLGREFQFVYGNPTDTIAQQNTAAFIRTISTAKRLRETKIGLVGYRPTGFYGSTFNEVAIRKTIGTGLIHIATNTLLDAYDGISHDAVAKDTANLNNATYRQGDASEEELANSSRLYLAIKQCVEAASVNALALKCWPELLTKRLLPCVANSRLNNEGIPVACEGDVHGVISQVIQKCLTDQPTFFCDMVHFDESRDGVLLWHCGACPISLAAEGETPQLNTMPSKTEDMRIGCPVVEFPLKPGRVTICRFCELAGEYRLFIAAGDAMNTSQELRGNCLWVRPDAGARKTVKFIIDRHVEHHFSVVYGDIAAELTSLCNFLGIRVLNADSSA